MSLSEHFTKGPTLARHASEQNLCRTLQKSNKQLEAISEVSCIDGIVAAGDGFDDFAAA
jgi:hypothetical protein